VDLKRAALPNDEACHAVSLHEDNRKADHRQDAVLHKFPTEKVDQNTLVLNMAVPSTVASRAQQVVLIVADQSTIDAMMIVVDAPKAELDQKVATAYHRADDHKAIQVADLAVTVAIVKGHRVEKDDLTDPAEKVVLTAIVDRLDQKAKADPSDAKLH
jgi:hypothetical protein